MKHTVIYIDGMTCINCQSRIWNVLKLRPEITGITVSYEYSRAEFDYDPKKIGMKEIVKMNRGSGISGNSRGTVSQETASSGSSGNFRDRPFICDPAAFWNP